jgi:tRNA threonylcarbamoyladenosine biosynthesis protein TsaB
MPNHIYSKAVIVSIVMYFLSKIKKKVVCFFILLYMSLMHILYVSKLKIERVNKDMYTLVFDTTAMGLVLALYKDMECKQKIEKFMEFGQAEELAVGVSELLEKENILFSDVDLLGVSVGPGSFTGVRAGVSFARGLALGHEELKITGVSNFDVYIEMLKKEYRAFYNAVVIETKREDFYFQLFDENLTKLTPPLALGRDEIREKLKSHKVSFIGDGVERLLSVPMGLDICHVELVDFVDYKALFGAVYKKYLAKNLDFPKPLYIRSAETCVK